MQTRVPLTAFDAKGVGTATSPIFVLLEKQNTLTRLRKDVATRAPSRTTTDDDGVQIVGDEMWIKLTRSDGTKFDVTAWPVADPGVECHQSETEHQRPVWNVKCQWRKRGEKRRRKKKHVVD